MSSTKIKPVKKNIYKKIFWENQTRFGKKRSSFRSNKKESRNSL